MGRALEIRNDLTAGELRAGAAREKSNRAARRLLAIANALDGMSRADAAKAAGMERQALRDAVVRYNAEGPAGVRNVLPGARVLRSTAGSGVAPRLAGVDSRDWARVAASSWT